MSAILEMAMQLRDVGEAIAKHERAIAKRSSPSLVASLRSLQKRMTRLESEFAALTASVGVDVCRYRFTPEDGRPTVEPVCSALSCFQAVATLAFNAVKNGPQAIAKVAPDVQQQTAFAFDYSFSGSLGIVLTFENAQLELIQSAMDDAMSAVFDIASSSTSADIIKKAKMLGPATVKALFQWSRAHIGSNLGADICWVRGDEIKNRLTLDSAGLTKLSEALAETSHTDVQILTVEGTFSGGEFTGKHAFHFIADDGTDYKGRYDDAISPDKPVQFPMRYRAQIKKTTKIFYAHDVDDKPSFFLIRLDPLS